MTLPEASLGTLHRADGSATYSNAGYSVICAVNGPIEVQRRDEIPDEAAIEVNIRPSIGVGGPRERHLETLLHSTFRHIILAHLHPRTLIQITLQILSLPEDESDLRSSAHIHLLPALLNTASLALLHASIPLSTTLSSTTIAVPHSASDKPHSAPVLDPSPSQVRQAKSVHVFAFSSSGEILLAESEGTFDVDEWEGVEVRAREACLGAGAEESPGAEEEEEGEGMEVDGEEDGGVSLGVDVGKASAAVEAKGLLGVVRKVVEDRVVEGEKWRGS
ncbi:Exosome complex component RRP46 [Sphaceloma murrayae]|uniref:Exosome complex component RRP46 n=1 Tax=Sphaceloma murrayae TaxID=2082308 RepID=A0A2K1QNP3_9PEZI|nr:Exosome complex component RRP46 [Sphaceloma murrayae]